MTSATSPSNIMLTAADTSTDANDEFNLEILPACPPAPQTADAQDFSSNTTSKAPPLKTTPLMHIKSGAKLSQQFEFDGMAKPIFSVLLQLGNNTHKQLSFHHASTLLEALESQNIDMPYQCRDGYCGACRCKKTGGDVTYLKNPMAWVNDDEILPCISVPKSDLQLQLK